MRAADSPARLSNKPISVILARTTRRKMALSLSFSRTQSRRQNCRYCCRFPCCIIAGEDTRLNAKFTATTTSLVRLDAPSAGVACTIRLRQYPSHTEGGETREKKRVKQRQNAGSNRRSCYCVRNLTFIKLILR